MHDVYYSNLNSVDNYINKNATWYVAPVTKTDVLTLDTIISEEKKWTWNGKIGMLSYSEYIYAQSPSSDGYSSCTDNVYENKSCGIDNWLNIGKDFWTLTPKTSSTRTTWCVYLEGVHDISSSSKRSIRPVVILNNNISLSGNGTIGENAFKIVK